MRASANLAEALAEGRSRAQADALRAMRTSTVARAAGRPRGAGDRAPAGRRRVIEAGQLIPGDGTVIEGIASVDESAIAGESAPVIPTRRRPQRRHGRHPRAVGPASSWRSPGRPGKSFLDRMIALVEGAARRKTPNEIALGILLACAHPDLLAGRDVTASVRAVRERRACPLRP